MKKMFVSAIMVLISLSLTGCGGSGSSASDLFFTQILSDPTYDGDIVHDLVTGGAFTVTQGNTQSVFAGVNPYTQMEYRAFLDFPLTGADGVPSNAVIVSARLNIVIKNIQPQAGTIPIRIELVYFQPPTLIPTDFDLDIQRALAITTNVPPISQADVGYNVSVDVTSLMAEAQRLGLPDFQIRILEDFSAVSPGLIEINDTTGAHRGDFAPLLKVTYN